MIIGSWNGGFGRIGWGVGGGVVVESKYNGNESDGKGCEPKECGCFGIHLVSVLCQIKFELENSLVVGWDTNTSLFHFYSPSITYTCKLTAVNNSFLWQSKVRTFIEYKRAKIVISKIMKC